MPRQCLDKNIKISPAAGHVRVIFDGKVIADTTRALNLDEPGAPLRIYIPRADVEAAYLAASDHHTTCPYKGEASYHSLKSANAVATNAAWFYPDPCPLVEQVRDHLAFWGGQVKYETAA